jgi:hypothetical protein
MTDHAAIPRARARPDRPGLGDDLLVFDATTNRAHSLNATAAAVWRACDGTRGRDQIAEHCQLDPVAVDMAVNNLADAKLLVEGYARLTERISRRSALRKAALTGAGISIALPVIRSVVAPSAAMAGSTAGSSCQSQIDYTGVGSHCHSHGTCEHSTCRSSTNSFSGEPHCASAPCCYGLTCFSSSGSASAHQCL